MINTKEKFMEGKNLGKVLIDKTYNILDARMSMIGSDMFRLCFGKINNENPILNAW